MMEQLDSSTARAFSEPPVADGQTSDVTLDKLAEAVCRRGLGACALFMLESVKPLNFIGSQLMYGLAPIASVLFNRERLDEFARTLEDRDSIERLMQRIEEKERQPSPRS